MLDFGSPDLYQCAVLLTG